LKTPSKAEHIIYHIPFKKKDNQPLFFKKAKTIRKKKEKNRKEKKI